MAVTSATTIRTLRSANAYVDDLFAHHGVALLPHHDTMTLYALCWVEGVDYGEVFADLDRLLDDDGPDRWPFDDQPEPTDEVFELADTAEEQRAGI